MEQRIRWLYEELPKWVSEGILTPEAADRLRARYGEVAAPGLRWGRIIWLVLAAVLVAFGALLILSDQWYALAHSVRFNWVVALAVAAQLAVAAVLALEPKAIAWREAAGAFLGIAIPGALQLAGDIYQLSEWNQIAWAIWSLALLLPAVYIVRSTALASIYLILTGVFVSSLGVTNAWLGAQQVWIWLALAAPDFYILLPRLRFSSGRWSANKPAGACRFAYWAAALWRYACCWPRNARYGWTYLKRYHRYCRLLCWYCCYSLPACFAGV